jgi:hypothetical protein
MSSNDDRIARIMKHIGFSDEPVLDAEGHWTIGYGRRLNDKRGGPRPAAVISEAMADEELRCRLASDEAEALAAMGRGHDTEIAHVALGEIVLPTVLQTPEVMRVLGDAARRACIPLDQLRIGMPQNSVNPCTGVAEFGLLGDLWQGFKGGISRAFGADDLGSSPTLPAPLRINGDIPEISVNAQPITEDLYGKRWFGTQWCGPGGAGPTVNAIDEACKRHDECYDHNGLRLGMNWGVGVSPDRTRALDQRRALQACNQVLCNEAGLDSDNGSSRVRGFFTALTPAGLCR